MTPPGGRENTSHGQPDVELVMASNGETGRMEWVELGWGGGEEAGYEVVIR